MDFIKKLIRNEAFIGVVAGFIGFGLFTLGVNQYKLHVNPKYHIQELSTSINADIEAMNADLDTYRELNIKAGSLKPGAPLFRVQIIRVKPPVATLTPKPSTAPASTSSVPAPKK